MKALADPLTVACRYCRASKGRPCRTASFKVLLPSRSHKVRKGDALAVAAHSDLVLDEHFPLRSPCGCCGWLPQRHRRVDGIAGMLAAGEDWDVAAEEHGVPFGAVESVARWMVKWPGAWL